LLGALRSQDRGVSPIRPRSHHDHDHRHRCDSRGEQRPLGRPGPWWPIFPFLWLLFIIGIIATFRFFGIRRWRQVQGQAGTRAGEARLAERYAAGEIDEQEYERRLGTLKRMGSS
jgi:putative membrane protein